MEAKPDLSAPQPPPEESLHFGQWQNDQQPQTEGRHGEGRSFRGGGGKENLLAPTVEFVAEFYRLQVEVVVDIVAAGQTFPREVEAVKDVEVPAGDNFAAEVVPGAEVHHNNSRSSEAAKVE